MLIPNEKMQWPFIRELIVFIIFVATNISFGSCKERKVNNNLKFANRFVFSVDHLRNITLNANGTVELNTILILTHTECEKHEENLLKNFDYYLDDDPFINILIHRQQHANLMWFDEIKQNLFNVYNVIACLEVLYFKPGTTLEKESLRWKKTNKMHFDDWFWNSLAFEISIENKLNKPLKVQIRYSPAKKSFVKPQLNNGDANKDYFAKVESIKAGGNLSLTVPYGTKVYFASVDGPQKNNVTFLSGTYVTEKKSFTFDKQFRPSHRRIVSYQTYFNKHKKEYQKARNQFTRDVSLEYLFAMRLSPRLKVHNELGYIGIKMTRRMKELLSDLSPASSSSSDTESNFIEIANLIRPLVDSFCKCSTIFNRIERERLGKITTDGLFTAVLSLDETEHVFNIKSVKGVEQKLKIDYEGLLIYESMRYASSLNKLSDKKMYAFIFKPKSWSELGSMSTITTSEIGHVFLTKDYDGNKFRLWPIEDGFKSSHDEL